jgi:hypothetical protein
MDLELEFHFNDGGISDFKILNPPTIPNQGEVISIQWEDFLTDARELEIIREIEENDVFKVDIFMRTYKRNSVTINARLYREKDYYEVMEDREKERKRLLGFS